MLTPEEIQAAVRLLGSRRTTSILNSKLVGWVEAEARIESLKPVSLIVAQFVEHNRPEVEACQTMADFLVETDRKTEQFRAFLRSREIAQPSTSEAAA